MIISTSISIFSNSSKILRALALPAFTISALIGSAPSYADCYSYDALGRLDKAQYSASSSDAALAATSYALDEHGNRQSVQTDSASSGTCAKPSTDIQQGESVPIESDLPPENQPPTASDFDINLVLGETFAANALVNASDPDGDILILSGVTSNHPTNISAQITAGSTMVEVASISGAGDFEVAYEVQDPDGATTSAIINVYVTQPAPEETGDGGDGDSGLNDPETSDPSCAGCEDY